MLYIFPEDCYTPGVGHKVSPLSVVPIQMVFLLYSQLSL